MLVGMVTRILELGLKTFASCVPGWLTACATYGQQLGDQSAHQAEVSAITTP